MAVTDIMGTSRLTEVVLIYTLLPTGDFFGDRIDTLVAEVDVTWIVFPLAVLFL